MKSLYKLSIRALVARSLWGSYWKDLSRSPCNVSVQELYRSLGKISVQALYRSSLGKISVYKSSLGKISVQDLCKRSLGKISVQAP